MRRWAAAFGAVIVALAAGAGLTLFFGWGMATLAIEGLARVAFHPAPDGWFTPVLLAMLLLGSIACSGALLGRWIGDRFNRWWGGGAPRAHPRAGSLSRRAAAALVSYLCGVGGGMGWGILLALAGRAAGEYGRTRDFLVAFAVLSAPTLGIIVTRAVANRIAGGGSAPPSAAAEAEPVPPPGPAPGDDGALHPCGAA